MITTLPREEIVSMLRRLSKEAGLGLHQFYDQGKTGRLDDPQLRDTWLIWGDVLTQSDIQGMG